MTEACLPESILPFLSLVFDIPDYKKTFLIIEIIVTKVNFLDRVILIESFHQAF
jgi:hypothetical protein